LLAVAPAVTAFAAAALEDAAARCLPAAGLATGDIGPVVRWAAKSGVQQIVTPFAPVGPVAAALDELARALAPHGIALVRVLRDHDRDLWPHATHSFFRFREAVA
jgi:deoxyribodipyrimidine photo-lyase